jgi:hypothetical protein
MSLFDVTELGLMLERVSQQDVLAAEPLARIIHVSFVKNPGWGLVSFPTISDSASGSNGLTR